MRSIARRRGARAVTGSGNRPRRALGTDPVPALHAELSGERLTLTGLLAGRGAHVLHDAVSALLRAGRPDWILDVSGLVVVDHTGLRAIVGCYQRALRHDCRVTVLGASPALRSALGRLRLDVHMLSQEDGVAAGRAV